jgi:hypothetical protein
MATFAATSPLGILLGMFILSLYGGGGAEGGGPVEQAKQAQLAMVSAVCQVGGHGMATGGRAGVSCQVTARCESAAGGQLVVGQLVVSLRSAGGQLVVVCGLVGVVVGVVVWAEV